MGRRLYLFLGILFVAIGFIGVFVPLLPTVPFLLLSAFCFERSSERLHNWLLGHKTFGPPIREWREHRVIRPRHKALALGFIIVGVSIPLSRPEMPWWLKAVVLLVITSVCVFILSQKNHRKPTGERSPENPGQGI